MLGPTRSAARRGLALAVVVLLAASCGTAERTTSATSSTQTLAPEGAEQWQLRVVDTFPHDPEAFTQGLLWAGDGQLFESTGRRGRSSLRRVEIASGDVAQRHDLDPQYFGEGLAQVGDELVQLTWQEHTAFRYDATTFDPSGTFTYDTEGWGLCFDGERFVMSDGTATLAFRDPTSFEVQGTVDVAFDGAPLAKLNELECVDGRIYANVLGDDRIFVIDPASGRVVAFVDASSLEPDANRTRGDVLNGIAYDPESGHFYLTGKNWSTMYEVVLSPDEPGGSS